MIAIMHSIARTMSPEIALFENSVDMESCLPAILLVQMMEYMIIRIDTVAMKLYRS